LVPVSREETADYRNPQPGQVWERKGGRVRIYDTKVIADRQWSWEVKAKLVSTLVISKSGGVSVRAKDFSRWAKPWPWSKPAVCVEWKDAAAREVAT